MSISVIKKSKRIFAEIHRKKLSISAKKRKINGFYGKHHSLKMKKYWSRIRKGKQTGELHPCWKGGKFISGGYIFIFCPNHPHRTARNYVAEHRLKMEKKLGRYLKRSELVHHINKNPSDNKLRNLKIMDRSEHKRLHANIQWGNNKN